MNLKIKLLITLFISIVITQAYSQTTEKLIKPSYLSIQTGGMIDNYNSMGIRTFFEYQKDLKKNWQYAVSYEHSRHLSSAATDHFDELETNLSIMSVNLYYKLKIFRDRIFWTSGLGLGLAHVNWEDNDKIGPTINASITLNIRITKNIYIETAPLLILAPTNRFYYSPMNASTYTDFLAGTFFPIGLKFKI